MAEFASNRQRNRMRNRIWAIFREAGGEDIFIRRDPLGDRYDVNQFGIYVEFETMQEALETRERALALLTIGGWEINRSDPKKPSQFSTTFTDAPCRASVDMPYSLPTGDEARIYISVTSTR